MSEENVELVKRSVEAINRRDLEALIALMDQDVQVHSRIVAIEGGLHGYEGFRIWWDNWLGAFLDWQVEVIGVRHAGDVVIATFRGVSHGATSRLPVEDNAWLASRWRNGKCVWWRACRSEVEALEAAGLSE